MLPCPPKVLTLLRCLLRNHCCLIVETAPASSAALLLPLVLRTLHPLPQSREVCLHPSSPCWPTSCLILAAARACGSGVGLHIPMSPAMQKLCKYSTLTPDLIFLVTVAAVSLAIQDLVSS
ncbi:hypothetical protein BD289DRAFT_124788 [Coniella lustricola]|uniref:Uncharacterized protein n=1 Tax=Coniella lustricola TaxID=2025994 RepID=A0A2T3AFR6_9PEZI|nr:hypothetical protein BD289DRAFT_124788 [Coniella lustricola]